MRGKSKYGAIPTVVDGIRFHSAGEARRHQELKLLERADAIRGLGRQRRYPLTINCGAVSVKLGDYIADFTYFENQNGRWVHVTEDFKGILTPLGKWKLKHFEAEYGVKVRITGAAARRKAAA